MPRELTAIGGSQSRDKGASAEFEAIFSDGIEWLQCRAENLTKINAKLMRLAQACFEFRRTEGTKLEKLSPFIATGISNWAAGYGTHGNDVAIEVQVTEGLPIQLAMSPIVARQTIEFLETALRAHSDPQIRPRRN